MRRPPPGVRLRPYADGDQALYAELFSDPAIWTLAGTPRTPAEAAALAERALAAQQDPAGRFRHAVVESDEGSLGLVGLAPAARLRVAGYVGQRQVAQGAHHPFDGAVVARVPGA